MYELIHSDCIKGLDYLIAQGKQFDVIPIDPPYNTKNKKNKAVSYDRNEDFQRKNWIPFYSNWDDIQNYVEWSSEWLSRARQLLAPKGTIFICGSFHNIPDVALALRAQMWYTIQWLQWCIPNSFPNLSMTKMINANQTVIWARQDEKITHIYDKESAKRYNNGKNLRDFWVINNDTQAGKKWKHPSKKPVTLMRRMIDIATRKDRSLRVLDFFGGSGTTGIAAWQLGQQYNIPIECTLIDREAEYIVMQKDRLYDECNRQETSIITL
jgi:site-specific DNA-methyltransferase (adenine-specific)